MSTSGVCFSAVALQNTDKKGILSKNPDGSYTQVVGALDVYNSGGIFYEAKEAEKLFLDSSSFQRRVKGGKLKAELGHPKLFGLNKLDAMVRYTTIMEPNVCAFHKKVWLDRGFLKTTDGKPIIAIIADIMPSGPHAEVLERSYANEGENVCWSIRSLADEYLERGRISRIINEIITFDWVTEQGIECAELFRHPAMESLDTTNHVRELLSGAITAATIENIQNRLRTVPGLAQEASGDMLQRLVNHVKKHDALPKSPKGIAGWFD
jgi:hypothetical protein